MTRNRLDRQIAAGHPCPSAAERELRVRQLTSPRAQRRAAQNLRRTVGYVDRVGSRPNFSAVVTNRGAVRAGRESILGLAERLERAAPVNARGMVLAGRLLTDGITSPLLYGTPERTVDQAIWEISDALGPEAPEYELDPVAW